MSKDLLRTINISNFTRFEHHHGNRHHKNNTHTQPSNFSYSYPTEISSFSLDSQRQVVNTDEKLKYYNTEIEHISKSRGQNYDLSAGFDSWIYRKVPTNEHLDHILTHLTYCLQNKADFGSNLRAKKPDFVMYRGMMSKILLTPYSMNESWSMNVVRFNGTLFIENNLTEQDIARVVDLDERSLKFMYSGYKFEQYGTMDTPQPHSQRSQQRQQQKQQQQQQQESPAEADGTPVPPPVNSIEEYSFVFTAKFSQFNMLIAAEVDCVDGEKPHTYPNSKYVELKTSKLIRSERDEYSFNRYKMIKFWIQSYLSGVPKIVVGFRDDHLVLRDVKVFNTNDIPRLACSKRKLWDYKVMLNVGVSVLEMLKSEITQNDPDIVYRLYYDSETRKIGLYKLDDTHKSFLLPEFMDAYKHL